MKRAKTSVYTKALEQPGKVKYTFFSLQLMRCLAVPPGMLGKGVVYNLMMLCSLMSQFMFKALLTI